MAKIAILHLSDLHFGVEPSPNVSSTAIAQRELVLQDLLNVLTSVGDDWKPGLIVISGDIGWKGVPSDYDKAAEWIRTLLARLALTHEDVLACPGNHDLDRLAAIGVEPPPSAVKADEWLKIENLANFSRPFSEYEAFCQRLGFRPFQVGACASQLIGHRSIGRLSFVTLNSAWFARGDTDKGNLWIGLPQLQVMAAARQLANPMDYDSVPITVIIMHHPKSWLADPEQNAYDARPNTYAYLAERSHVILAGHVHGAIERVDRVHNRAYLFVGGATYYGSNYRNNCSILQVDLDQRLLLRRAFEFDPRSSWREVLEQDPYSLLRPTLARKRLTHGTRPLASAITQARQKRWRDLEWLRYPVLAGDDHEVSRRAFALRLAIGLHKRFGTYGHMRFNALLRTRGEKRKGHLITLYELVCHQPEFVAIVREDRRIFIKSFLELSQKGDEGLAIMKRQVFDEWDRLKIEMQWEVEIPFSETFVPLSLIYDPQAQKIIIRDIKKLSVDPANYDQRVRTTSELLVFLASLRWARFAYAGELRSYRENYPLLKLMIDAIDNNAITWDRVRINAENYEEWDYLNPEFDEEVRPRRGRG